MKTLTLLLEMRCNNFCVFCGQRAVDAAMIEKREELDLSVPTGERVIQPEADAPLEEKRYTLESALETLTTAAAEGYTNLSLQGGEPSLWPWVIELCQAAHDLGYNEIQIVTNGQKFANRRFSEKILEAQLTAIVFSLLGADAETHDRQTLVPGSFDKIITGIQNCLEIAKEIDSEVLMTAGVVVSNWNYRQLPELVDLMSSVGLTGGRFSLVRFNHFGDDPKVREWLRFHVADAVPYVVEARERAEASGFTLEVDGFPACLLPSIRSVELKMWQRRRVAEAHTFSGPAFEYGARGGDPEGDDHPNGEEAEEPVSTRGPIRSFVDSLMKTFAKSAPRQPTAAAPAPTPEPSDAGGSWNQRPVEASALRRAAFGRCDTCLLESGCGKPPLDHIDPDRAGCFDPVTFDTFRAQARALGAVDKRIEWRLFDWRGTLDTLVRAKLISDEEVGLLEEDYMAACHEALGALPPGDTENRRRLFARTLGLQLPRSLRSADLRNWGDGWLRWSRSRTASNAGGSSPPPTHHIDASFAGGFGMNLPVVKADDDTYTVIDVDPRLPTEMPESAGTDGPAFFFGDLIRPLLNQATVRFDGAKLQAQGSDGRWHPVILPVEPDTGLVSLTISEA